MDVGLVNSLVADFCISVSSTWSRRVLRLVDLGRRLRVDWCFFPAIPRWREVGFKPDYSLGIWRPAPLEANFAQEENFFGSDDDVFVGLRCMCSIIANAT